MNSPKLLASTVGAALCLSACVSNPEKGIFGVTQYLQFTVASAIIFEYAVPGGGMPCAQNAATNNRELPGDSAGKYQCASEPASEAELPYSYVSVSLFGTGAFQGYRQSNPTTTRWASSEDCWDSVAGLPKDNQKLVKESCGPKPDPRLVPLPTPAPSPAPAPGPAPVPRGAKTA